MFYTVENSYGEFKMGISSNYILLNREPELLTTEAQMLNQGTHPKSGDDRFRVAFFGSFWAKQKRTNKDIDRYKL